MKPRKVSEDLVKKTVETLDETEDAILGVKTGVKAGDVTTCEPGSCPATPYGVGNE